jgi:hypothetical protein
MVYAFGVNPPLGNTGAPGQGTCASCHGTLTAGSGVTVTAPTTYTPGGAAVSMTVSIPTTGGFELAVLTQSGNAQAGTLAAGTQDAVTTSGAIQYVSSAAETTSWTFLWTPPATNVGNVVLYVTGGTNGSSGSHSYVITPAAAPTPNFSLSATSPPTVAAGASGTSTITVAPTNGFTGSVNLAASGLPSGVTPSFTPNPATSTSTLTFTASSTAAAGTSTVTITGTSGTLTHTTTVSLTVSAAAPAPNFGLSALPTMVGISQGASQTSTITVAPTNGFTGSVNLAASGLPTGVTPSFSANPATSTSTLTFTASSTAAPGTSTITVTGTSGTLSHTTTITLMVNAVATPNFSLSASPATVTQGASGTSKITVTPTAGFTGSVNLAVSGLPSGVTPSFTPNPATSTSTLTFTASSTAAPGTSTVTVTGTSGTLSHTTTITLVVSAVATRDFSLSASPATVAQGASGTSTITVNPTAGYTGSVNLAASGLPSGVTPSFTPNPATSTSTLTFTASSTAAPGTSTVTVTGTSGTLSHTTTLTLTVTSPVSASSLTVSPSSLSFTSLSTGGDDASEGSGTQRLAIAGTTKAAVSYTTKETTQSGGSWLMLGSSGGTTPGTLVVSVNTRGMASGIYHGTITITPDGAAAGARLVPVTLTVGSPTTSSLRVTPRRLTFSFSGTTDTGSKTVQVTSSTPREFSVAASGGSWLDVRTTSPTTPATLTVSVDARGLSTGTYSGMITLTAGTRKTSVYVTMFVATSTSGGGGDDGSETESQLAVQPIVNDPTNSGTVGAALLDAAGVPVSSGTTTSNPGNLALALSKTVHAPAGTSAGAQLVGAENLVKLTELGFDVRQGGHCTANSPHFVVVTSDDVTHVLTGCANGTIQTAPAQGWIRVRFDPANPAQASPPIAPGQSIKSIAIVLDQGPEATPNPGGGLVVLDNIDVNGVIVGKD